MCLMKIKRRRESCWGGGEGGEESLCARVKMKAKEIERGRAVGRVGRGDGVLSGRCE